MVDDLDNDAIVHIRVDSSYMQKYEQLRYQMLEQMVASTYENATISKSMNEYGLLTDIWIKFSDTNDATHFKLSRYTP